MSNQNQSDPSSNNQVFSTQEPFKQLLNQWERLRGLTSEISKKSGQMDELMQALHALSFVLQDKNKFQEFISTLAKLNQAQLQKPNPVSTPDKAGDKPAGGNKPAATKPAPGDKPAEKSDPQLVGDTFYDLFNSPAMSEIVKEVMKRKSKRRY